MNRLDNSEFIGTFKVKSGHIIVTDPCYQRDDKLNIIIENVENGNWDSYMKLNENGKVIELYVSHSNTSKKTIKKNYWNDQYIDISVDSGKCGIFDESLYPYDVKSFYNDCCNLTLNNYAGTLNFGVVSNSGEGDGLYTCCTMSDENDKIIGIKIVFINEDGDDDDNLYLDDKDIDELDRCDYMDYDDINEYD